MKVVDGAAEGSTPVTAARTSGMASGRAAAKYVCGRLSILLSPNARDRTTRVRLGRAIGFMAPTLPSQVQRLTGSQRGRRSVSCEPVNLCTCDPLFIAP